MAKIFHLGKVVHRRISKRPLAAHYPAGDEVELAKRIAREQRMITEARTRRTNTFETNAYTPTAYSILASARAIAKGRSANTLQNVGALQILREYWTHGTPTKLDKSMAAKRQYQ